MSYGLLPTGFLPKSLEIIREELNARARDRFGASSLDVSDGSILGDILGILAEPLADLWSLGEALNAANDPRAATGAFLDALCLLTGVRRHEATASQTVLTATGTPATNIPLGSLVSTVSTAVQFETLAAGVIGTLTAWAISTAYVVGDRRTNASRAYEVTIAGTSAGAGGPTTSDSAIVDGTVTWRYLGEGTGAVDINAEATATGPTVAVAGDITNIDSPVAGWQSVRNLSDAVLGTDIETDEALRLRRFDELSAAGAGTPDAIRATLLTISGVTEAHVFDNKTDLTDGDGLPPHSFEAVVRTPTISAALDQLIREAIHDENPAGIVSYGSVSGTVVDSEGVNQTILFSRPTIIPIYVAITVTVNPQGASNSDLKFPTDGIDAVKLAIVENASEITGANVVAAAVGSKAFLVPGVLDVTPTYIGLAPAPGTSVTIPISLRESADFDTSRISVTVVNGTP